ncbi:MAG: DUF721 domain-containing protein [Fibromonadales bacterium]|nr:DUF721 domain-containing protein [Fibromonadales bacterium]
MVKYEPYFFVDSKDPGDIAKKKRRGPALCKEDPLIAGSLAANILDSFISQEQKDAMILDENKAQILPGKLNEKVKIETLKGETLILKATSSVWRAEIMAKKTDIVAVCNKILGKIAIKTIKIQ